ncbi:MAG: hypothetical protein ACREB3_01510, partial [Burkholderiales bacterium]
MSRHFSGLYVWAAVELVTGGALSWGAWTLLPQVYRHANSRLDDWLAASALALAGPAIFAAGLATLFHRRLPDGLVRGAQIVAGIAEAWMILAGAGIVMVGRRRGGDWAGFTILGGTVFLAAGVLLLLVSLFGLRYLSRLRT